MLMAVGRAWGLQPAMLISGVLGLWGLIFVGLGADLGLRA